jgi:hypothetical protein
MARPRYPGQRHWADYENLRESDTRAAGWTYLVGTQMDDIARQEASRRGRTAEAQGQQLRLGLELED